jgi:hypothetical protein
MTTHSQMREFGPCCSRTACSGDIRDGAAPEHTCACHEHYGEGRCIYGEADNANYAKVEELFPGFQHALRRAGYSRYRVRFASRRPSVTVSSTRPQARLMKLRKHHPRRQYGGRKTRHEARLEIGHENRNADRR